MDKQAFISGYLLEKQAIDEKEVVDWLFPKSVSEESKLPEEYKKYNIDPLDAFLSHGNGKLPEFISFPENEIEQLKNRDIIYTTRILNELNKYKKGKQYITPWGEIYKVKDIKDFENIKSHPFYDELTDEQRKQIGKNKYQILKLLPKNWNILKKMK